MATKPDAKAFVAVFGRGNGADEPTAPLTGTPPLAESGGASVEKPLEPRRHRRGKIRPPRHELIHFGGYLSSETFEKIALLRLRLKKDNSELIELAIEELFRKNSAKQAFGDT